MAEATNSTKRKARPSRPTPRTITRAAKAAALPADGEAMSWQRHEQIARAAYFRAERRNFAPGHELGDWLAAERDIDGAGGNT